MGQTPDAIAAAVADMKREILADMARGTIPTSVTDFSDLHSYVDANTYAGFCGDARGNWDTEDLAAVQQIVHEWLESGHGAAVPIAYEFRANVYCPDCIGAALPTGDGQEFDGWKIAPGIRVSAEENLNEIAAAFGYSRDVETSYDSADFPKVAVPAALYAGESCHACKRDLTA